MLWNFSKGKLRDQFLRRGIINISFYRLASAGFWADEEDFMREISKIQMPSRSSIRDKRNFNRDKNHNCNKWNPLKRLTKETKSSDIFIQKATLTLSSSNIKLSIYKTKVRNVLCNELLKSKKELNNTFFYWSKIKLMNY